MTLYDSKEQSKCLNFSLSFLKLFFIYIWVRRHFICCFCAPAVNRPAPTVPFLISLPAIVVRDGLPLTEENPSSVSFTLKFRGKLIPLSGQ